MEEWIVEVGLGVVIASVGFLLKRAVQSLDTTLQEIVQTIHGTSTGDTGLKSRVMVLEEKAVEQDEQIERIDTKLEELHSQLQQAAVKNAENFGEVKTDIREVLTRIRSMQNGQA